MKFLELNSKYKNFMFIILSYLFLVVAFLFDKTLVVGIIFIAFLTAIVFLVLKKISFKNKIIYTLFLIAFLIHIAAVLFIYYAHFQPFSGEEGDYIEYQQQAQEIAQRVHQGNFSLQGLNIGHYYPVIVGYLYAFTVPNMLIGQLFSAWLAALSVLFIYLIVLEIGGSEKEGFLVGLIASIYPSLAFYGSLLLKDALVVLLSSIALLLTLKLIKKFSLGGFLILYMVLGGLIHFRFYIGYAALLTFLICWSLFSNLNLKKRIGYLIIIIPLLGFLPQVFAGQGYFGATFLKTYLNRGTISYYREIVFAPSVQSSQIQPQPTTPQSTTLPPVGKESSIIVRTGFENFLIFSKNTSLSFIYVLLGPLPWQLTRLKHLLVLPEVIIWYFLLFFIIKGIIKNIGKQYKVILPLIIFSCLVFGVLATFLNNFGIVTRIRIPAFLALLCLFPLGFKGFKNIKIPFLNNLDI